MFSFIEFIQYEGRPYFYAILAGIAFYNQGTTKILVVFGSMLVVCSFAILSMRYEHRILKQRK